MKRPSIFNVVIGSIVLAGVFASVASAWTGPSGAPPNNNVAAPINTSASGQTKTGDFATQGKIGAGTFTPNASYKLDVYNSTAAQGTAYFHNTSGGIAFGPYNSTWTHVYSDNANAPFIFNTDIFTIAGGISSYNGDLALKTGIGGATTSPTRMTLQTTGNVGIGTTNPAFRLELAFATNPGIALHYIGAAAAGNKGYITFTHNRASDSTQEWLGYIQGVAEDNQSKGGLRFVTRNNADVEALRLTSNGGVVIGTANQYGTSPLTVDTVRIGSGNWAQIVNYNVGTPYGSYGVYSYGAVYAFYGNGPIYGGSFLYTSDARFKHNVKNLDLGLIALMKMRPVSFTWNEDAPDIGSRNKDDIGFIAQEIETVYPAAVHTDPKTGYKTLDYPKLIPILAQAIQDQQKEIESLTARIEALEAKLK